MPGKKESREPGDLILHNIANKLTIIAGHCDLLSEMVEPKSEVARRLAIIRDNAHRSLEELQEFQRKARAERLAG